MVELVSMKISGFQERPVLSELFAAKRAAAKASDKPKTVETFSCKRVNKIQQISMRRRSMEDQRVMNDDDDQT